MTNDHPPVAVVLRDEQGRAYALACPTCGSLDVQELDHGIRRNTLRVAAEGDLRGNLGDSFFEHDAILCDECHTELVLPEGWQITDWG